MSRVQGGTFSFCFPLKLSSWSPWKTEIWGSVTTYNKTHSKSELLPNVTNFQPLQTFRLSCPWPLFFRLRSCDELHLGRLHSRVSLVDWIWLKHKSSHLERFGGRAGKWCDVGNPPQWGSSEPSGIWAKVKMCTLQEAGDSQVKIDKGNHSGADILTFMLRSIKPRDSELRSWGGGFPPTFPESKFQHFLGEKLG